MNWVIYQKIDLSQNSKKAWDESTYAFTGDDNAHSWVVEVFSSGSAADLSGYAASAYFIRADGNTVIASGSISQNTVNVELPQSCYSVPGVVKGVLKITKTGSTVTVGAIKFSVSTSTTDTLVDPEHIVPSIEELLSILAEIDQIADAEQERVEAEQGRVAAEEAREEAFAQFEQAVESGEYNGATFTPAVSAAGVISWANDKGLANPASVNIMGPQGPAGADGAPGAKGDKGNKGDTGDSGVYLGSTEPADETVKVWINPDGESTPILDDESVGAKPWSSKQIIDTLCPPLEVAGNPVQCYPVANYPLGAQASWEPRQEGSGDPSPDNVRPIAGMDETRVTRCGKNLLDVDEITGIRWAASQMPQAEMEILNTFNNLPVGEYRFTADLRIDSVEDTISDTNQLLYGIIVRNSQDINNSEAVNRNSLVIGNVPSVGDILRVNTKVLIKPEYAGTYDQIYLYSAGSNNTKDRTSGTMYNFQLEPGSTPTAYAPYTGTTATLTLPETIYGGTVDAVTGAGSKTWGYIASYNGEPLPGEWISDRDVYSSGTTPATGAQVAYKLATPQPIQATGGQSLPALPGTNTVYTDADSVTVTGRADPVQTINALNDRIAALEDAATGG